MAKKNYQFAEYVHPEDAWVAWSERRQARLEAIQIEQEKESENEKD